MNTSYDTKYNRRDKARGKRRYGMRVSGAFNKQTPELMARRAEKTQGGK